MAKTKNLFELVWSVKDSGEVKIPKTFNLKELVVEINHFNDKNNEWSISEVVEESDDNKFWIIYGFN